MCRHWAGGTLEKRMSKKRRGWREDHVPRHKQTVKGYLSTPGASLHGMQHMAASGAAMRRRAEEEEEQEEQEERRRGGEEEERKRKRKRKGVSTGRSRLTPSLRPDWHPVGHLSMHCSRHELHQSVTVEVHADRHRAIVWNGPILLHHHFTVSWAELHRI
ncbi:hypothetical protein LX36DRAFT_308761 [Colletotrichum falcatum]|nr:hypothetical protein LX36DRAFT_308761 [Colletotrichum falcatum]